MTGHRVTNLKRAVRKHYKKAAAQKKQESEPGRTRGNLYCCSPVALVDLGVPSVVRSNLPWKTATKNAKDCWTWNKAFVGFNVDKKGRFQDSLLRHLGRCENCLRGQKKKNWKLEENNKSFQNWSGCFLNNICCWSTWRVRPVASVEELWRLCHMASI